MAILLPAVKTFVIVGDALKHTLETHECYRNYFQNKQSKLCHVSQVSSINFETIKRDTSLFIIKSFGNDVETSTQLNFSFQKRSRKFDKQLLCPSTYSNAAATNNNHISVHRSPLQATVEEEDEEEEQKTEVEKECLSKQHVATEEDVRSCKNNNSTYTTETDDIEDEDSDMLIQSIEDTDDGSTFSFLFENRCSIMGFIALLQTIKKLTCLDDDIKMVSNERPLNNFAMHNMIVTFSGIASKVEAQQLLTLTRWMGSKSREDVTHRTTHLVAGNVKGVKYRRAAELGLAIVNTKWVMDSFKLGQKDIAFYAGLPEVIQSYKLKPFHGLSLSFEGFREEDIKELHELTLTNEGSIVESNSVGCTHIVVDAISGYDENGSHVPLSSSSNVHVVYKEWFWACLEMEGKANEDPYAVPGYKSLTRRTSKNFTSTGHNSFSVLSPMLDYSRSPESMFDRRQSRHQSSPQEKQQLVEKQPDLDQLTARHRICLELVQTERNYVKILDTIVNLFKLPLESPEMGDPIISPAEVRIIFGNLGPIYEVHKRMSGQLEELIEKNWKETNLVGKVFVSHSIELLKAYPPFVNFFEDTKKTIQNCDFKYPRFHAFLKKCQSKIECNRESLTEMIIRPVQRLPSISLIVNELIKRTDDSNPDKKFLKEALDSIRRVMSLINEGKRITEGRIAMFDIINSIEECPPDLLSDHRRFICRVEARLLFLNNENEVVPSRSHKIILFLFSDRLELCKVRSLKRSHSMSVRTYGTIRRGLNPMLNGSAKFAQPLASRKDYRHLDELLLYDIRNIFTKFESSELADAIVIQARPSEKYDQNFRYYPIALEDQVMTKATFVEKLENCLFTRELDELGASYTPNDTTLSNDEIDFGFANLLISVLEKSRLSRVRSIRQVLLSPSVHLRTH